MYINFNRNVEKIFIEFTKINKLAKALIKYGTRVFLALFLIGTLFILVNHTLLNFNNYYEFVATTIIKTSFIIFAEAVIGGLLLDYVFKTK